MDTIDQVFGEYLSGKYMATLQEATDFSTWTDENRDAKMEELEAIFEKIINEGVGFIKSLHEAEVDGKTIMYWILYSFLCVEILSHFRNVRDLIDMERDEAVSDIPLDYQWICKTIKERISKITEAQEKIGSYMRSAIDTGSEEV